ncbi:MAG: hypothetical protein QOC94_1641 [Actinoplanes sp.]|jgi:predicted secreted Zn-dependent protease|nr:hypothetical protein [Actinoplanes sp.]
MTRSTNKLEWRRSRSCGSGACIEVAKVGDLFMIRDSKNPAAPPLSFTADEWAAFTGGVFAGDFDFE